MEYNYSMKEYVACAEQPVVIAVVAVMVEMAVVVVGWCGILMLMMRLG